MDPGINLSGSDVLTLTPNWTTGAVTGSSQGGVTDLTNVIYYVILLPFGVVGNALSLVVSFCLLRGNNERRLSADIYCAFLATTDLLCVAAIHIPTVILLLSSGHTTVPDDLCRFQATATTLYLNVEFVLQIAMSMDRYSALTRPMQYKATSQNIPCLLLVLVICISLSYILIFYAFLSTTSTVTMTTWRFCTHLWHVTTGVDNLKVFFVFIWFVGGLALFIRSNLALVCVLCRYNQQRSSAVLEEIERVKRAIERRQTESANRKRQLSPVPAIVVQSSKSGEPLNASNSKKRKTSATSLSQHGIVGVQSSPVILITGPSEADLTLCHQQDSSQTRQLCHSTFTNDTKIQTQSQSSMKYQPCHVTESSSNPCLTLHTTGLLSEGVFSSKVKVRRHTFPLDVSSRKHQFSSVSTANYFDTNNATKSDGKRDSIAVQHSDVQLTNHNQAAQVKVINCAAREGERRVHVMSQGSHASDMCHLVTRPLYDRSVSNTSTKSAKRFHENVKRLLYRLEVKARRQKNEILLARVIVICSCVFVATLFPYAVMSALDAIGLSVSSTARQLATRCIFLNIILNPIFHGLCRKKYRAGYDYLVQVCCYNISCGIFNKPHDDKVFYDCRKKRRLQQQLDQRRMIVNNNRAPPPPFRKPRPLLPVNHSHYDQVPLALDDNDRPLTSVAKQTQTGGTGGESKGFHPSPKLHDLFNRHEASAAAAAARATLSPSSSSNVLSIDYDALVFGDQQLYDNLRHVRSLLQHMPASGSVTPDGSSDEDEEEGVREMGCDFTHLTVPQLGMALSRSFDAHERRRLSAVSSHGNQVYTPTDDSSRLVMSFSLSASNFHCAQTPKS